MICFCNWDERHENKRSRQIGRCVRFYASNDFEDEYLDLVDGADGAAFLGVYTALVMVASRGAPPRIGELVKSGGQAHDVGSLARLTRLPESLVGAAIERMIGIGLLKVGDSKSMDGSQGTDEGPTRGRRRDDEGTTKGRRRDDEGTTEGKEQNLKRIESPPNPPQAGGETDHDKTSKSGPANEKTNGRRKKNNPIHDPAFAGRFQRFWAPYPQKVKRPEAYAALACINPDEEKLAAILAGLNRWKRSAQWKRDNGRYIPNPATWLNNAQWEDVVPGAEDEPRAGGEPARDPATITAVSAQEREVWAHARDALRSGIPEEEFTIWIEPIELCGVTADGGLVLGCPNEGAMNWCSSHFRELIFKAVGSRNVEFDVCSNNGSDAADSAAVEQ